MKSKIKYMHTISGHPAEYYDNQQICYASHRKPVTLVESLSKIKKQQRASNKYRKVQNFAPSYDYSWVRVFIN